MLIPSLLPQTENSTAPSGPATRPGEQRGECPCRARARVAWHAVAGVACCGVAGFPSHSLPPQGFQPFGDTGGFHFSFGVGAFPFGFFTTVFNAHEPFRRGAGKSFLSLSPGQGHPPPAPPTCPFSCRCGSGTGSPRLQLARLPVPVSRHLLLFLAAQYLSCVSPAHLQLEENQYWGPCWPRLAFGPPLTPMTYVC